MILKKKIAVSETGFIFDPTSGDSFSMNPTATEILSLIKEGKSEKEIKSYFIANYDVNESTFDRNYIDFVSMLRLHNLIDENEKN
jgi:hypothetical protein